MSKCIKCLSDTPLDEFLRNDHICDTCASGYETFPLASPNHFDTYSPVEVEPVFITGLSKHENKP